MACARIVCLLGVLAVLGLGPSPVSHQAVARTPTRVHVSRASQERAEFLAARARIRYQQWIQERKLQAQRRAARRLALKRQRLQALHHDFWLHAVDTQLYTAWGTPITLKAINWYGFEYAPFVPAGLDKAPLDYILHTLRSVGFNSLRLMYADETVQDNPVVTKGLDANPQLKGLHSLDIMQRILQRAHHFGLRVILCNSRSEAGMGPEHETGLWYTRQYPESVWEEDWETLATRFRHDSAFVGADLRNEPHITGSDFSLNAYFTLGPLWGAFKGVYYHDRDWHYAAEMMGNKLLAINPHLLIIVEGVELYYNPDHDSLSGGLWGSNLTGVQYDPVVLDKPGQLVYSAHEYGPQMWRGAWFTPQTTYHSLAHRWSHLWGYLLKAPRFMRAPIFIGEFGTCNNYYSCTVSNNPLKQGFWLKAFTRYMAKRPQIGWAYWALNTLGPFQPNQINYYSLMYPDWKHVHQNIVEGLAPLLSEPDG
jgi:endoglucanase